MGAARRRLSTSAVLAILACSVSLSATAANDAMLDLLKVLRDNGTISAEAYEVLRNSAQADEEKMVAQTSETAKAEVEKVALEKKTADSPIITTKGKLQFEGEDWSWRIGGRLMHDITLADGDGEAGINSGHEIRRARIYLSGTAWKHWDYKLQFDLEDADDSSQVVEDAYVRYTGWDFGRITIGQRKAPFSLNELTSSKYMTFIERATPSNLFASEAMGIGNRAPGLTFETNGNDLWTIAAGYYLHRQNDGNHPRAIDDGHGFTGRLTLSPIHEKSKAVHIGVAGGFRNASNDIGRLRVRPAVNSGDRIIDTDVSLGAEDAYAIGAEGAVVWGPASIQGEYYWASLDDIGSTSSDYDMDGFYIYGSYFLTGESRNYKWKSGVFSSVKPNNPLFKGGLGAWEVAVRYSSTNIDSNSTVGIGGDEGDILTAGINWYVNNNLMFKANYVQVLDCDPCDWGDEEPSYFLLRSQIFF